VINGFLFLVAKKTKLRVLHIAPSHSVRRTTSIMSNQPQEKSTLGEPKSSKYAHKSQTRHKTMKNPS
jgi:hypothetical protein